MNMREAVAAYRAGNNAGNGFAPDVPAIDDVVAAYVKEGWILLLERHTSDDVAVVQNGSLVYAIGGDAMGGNAWCVDISL